MTSERLFREQCSNSCERAQINGLSFLKRIMAGENSPGPETEEVERAALAHFKSCDQNLCQEGNIFVSVFSQTLGDLWLDPHFGFSKFAEIPIAGQVQLTASIFKWEQKISQQLESNGPNFSS